MAKHRVSRKGKHRARTHRLRAVAGVAVGTTLAGGTLLGTIGTAHADVNWDAVAQCESGGNWATSTGNGFYGGLQFAASTWRANGGSGMPQHASRAEQIRVAENVLRTQGIDAWPACGKKAGNTKPAKAEPAPKPAMPVSTAPGATYTVVSGDTLATIAAVNGTTWQALQVANAIPNPNVIQVGQMLRIPSGTPAPASPVKPATYSVTAAGTSGGVATRAVSAAVAQVGTPYRYGGESPSGFDCSGLIQYAYQKAGINLPRTAAAQSTVGKPVSLSELQPGDLIFFYHPITHVAVYVGHGEVAEASQPGTPVHVRAIYLTGFVGAHRPIG